MFYQMMPGSQNYMNLQATISSASAIHQVVTPHHPVTCTGPLFVDDDSFYCDHAKVALDEERTRAAIIHSIAILMFEIAGETL